MKQESLIDIVRGILPPDKYSNIQPFRGETGSMRQTFTASWGRNNRKVFIKVDKAPEGSNAKFLRSRGCTTSREISVLSSIGIDEALANHISPLIDFYETKYQSVSIEPEFIDSKSLKRVVEEEGVLTPKEFEITFSQVTKGVRYLINDRMLYHRDLTPSNLLIRRNGNIEARITDLANSSSTTETKESADPTAGARFVRDPLLGDSFTGQESRYSEQAEIYALGINMFYALTGKVPFKYDFLGNEGINAVTEEDILNNGQLDRIKHTRALEKGLRLIPKRSRKYSEVIRRCLTIDPLARFKSIDELVEDFDESTKKNSRLKSRINRFLLGSLFAASLAVPGFNYLHQDVETEVVEQKYPVTADISGSNLEIENNLVGLQLMFYKTNPFQVLDASKGYLSLSEGDSLEVRVTVKEKPWPNKSHASLPSFEGKLYFEGFPPKKFFAYVEPYNDLDYDMNVWQPEVKIEVPKKEGNYILTAEIYAHDRPDKENVITALGEIEYSDPGKGLAKRRVQVVVGKVNDKLWLNSVSLGGYAAERGFIRTYGDSSLKEKLICEVSIPEEGFTYNPEKNPVSNGIFAYIPMPRGENTDPRTLQFALRNEKDTIVGYYAVPVQREWITEKFFWWKLALPTPEFSERLVEYRKALERNN